MRNKKNRADLDKLFILGAGASLAASKINHRSNKIPTYQSPLDSEFPIRISALDLQRPNWVAEAKEKVVSNFRPDGEFEDFGLEQSIIRQLGLLELFESLHPRRSRNQISPQKWLNLLSHLICTILRRARENRSKPYKTLIDKYFPSDKPIEELSNRIITFNYDTLLDDHLLEDRDITDIYFDTIRSRRDRPSKAKQNHPLLLKLHGSINWRCSENDLKSIIEGPQEEITEYQVDRVWVDNSSPPSPKDEVSPFIMPPLPSKPITSIKLFNWLWTRAYEYLYEAKELVIVGYSLPETDGVAEAMFGSFHNNDLERIILVDPSTSTLDRWRDVLGRTGLRKLRWTYYESLSDFLENESVA